MTTPTTITETDDITRTITDVATVTTDVWVTVTVPTTVTDIVGVAKRNLERRQATITPSAIPSYAVGPCSANVESYISACLCYSATASTTYAPTPVTTVTVTTTTTVPSISAAHVTETDVATAWSTITEVETSTATVAAVTSETATSFRIYISAPGQDGVDGTYVSVDTQSQNVVNQIVYSLRFGATSANAATFAWDTTLNNLILPGRSGVDGKPLELGLENPTDQASAVWAVAQSQVTLENGAALSCSVAASTNEVSCLVNALNTWDTTIYEDFVFLSQPWDSGVTFYAEPI